MKIVKLPGFGVVWYPDNYDATKSYRGKIWLHGVGGRGAATIASLDLLILGTPPNTPPEVSIDLQKNVDAEQYVLIAPQILGDWTVADVDKAVATFPASVDQNRLDLIGFSLGGGGVLRYITSSLAAAQKLATATVLAPTPVTGNYKNVADANLPVLFVNCANEWNTGTPVSASIDAQAAINAYNPTAKALRILYNTGGHGYNDLFRNDNITPAGPSVATIFNPTQSIYKWHAANTKDSGIVMTGGVPGPVGLPNFDLGPDTEITGTSIAVHILNAQNMKIGDYDAFQFSFMTYSGSWNPVVTPAGIYSSTTTGKTYSNLLPGSYEVFVTGKGLNGSIITRTKKITVKSATEPVPNPVVRLLLLDGTSVNATLEEENGYYKFKKI